MTAATSAEKAQHDERGRACEQRRSNSFHVGESYHDSPDRSDREDPRAATIGDALFEGVPTTTGSSVKSPPVLPKIMKGRNTPSQDREQASLVREQVTEIVSSWESRAQDVESLGNVSEQKEISVAVAEVQKLLREWEQLMKDNKIAERSESISEEELTAFQNLLLSWEKYRLLDHNQLVPKSYIRGEVGRASFDPTKSHDLDAHVVAREANRRLKKVEVFPSAEKLDRGSGHTHVNVERSDSITAFLPDDIENHDPVQLNRLWAQLLVEKPSRGFLVSSMEKEMRREMEPEKEFGGAEVLSATSTTRSVSTISFVEPGIEYVPISTPASDSLSPWSSQAISPTSLSLFFLSKTTNIVHVRERLKLLVRPRRGDERETRFIALKSIEETKEAVMNALEDMNSEMVSRIGGRKIKCRIPLGEHTLYAVVYLDAVRESATKVTFLRSRDDKGLTDSKDFIASYQVLASRCLQS